MDRLLLKKNTKILASLFREYSFSPPTLGFFVQTTNQKKIYPSSCVNALTNSNSEGHDNQPLNMHFIKNNLNLSQLDFSAHSGWCFSFLSLFHYSKLRLNSDHIGMWGEGVGATTVRYTVGWWKGRREVRLHQWARSRVFGNRNDKKEKKKKKKRRTCFN